ncbi:MAG: pyruvate:ferredoxin (flavodoxin) oxidoreductase [Armatimonadetes bacterium]|nr:pyruvate:ferredoxin (flavodoxin) oxidoreductase [Armatimonadota bacterium]
MKKHQFITLDGNEAVARVAYKLNEVAALYPITPSSNMGEFIDAWAAEGRKNLWGTVPRVVEMQSEAGAAGAVHGALQAGSLTTTFTASQGLLLMIPNMYKIAGELTPTTFHVSARSLAAQALSIFGDHSDVMAVRQTGFALLSSASVQEAHDMALVAHASSLRSRIPFVHFFDGFRTSHEVDKIEALSDEDIRALIKDEWVIQHRERALSPDRPVLRGTAQNPDVYFQGRETVNPFYAACPDVVQDIMNQLAEQTGRSYNLFDYVGHPQAERVIVLMGSGCEAAHETVEYLAERGEKVGLVKVRLYRPFDSKRFVEALPRTVKAIAVLDRTKEPGSLGEPLYLDCVTALMESCSNGSSPLPAVPRTVGGRYGLSSKEFNPAMVKAVLDNLSSPQPKNHFTIGINDDVSLTSLPFDPSFNIEPEDVVRALFYGLGSDGTVGANKNSIKIIGENTDNYAQGYFVYDSKKSGAITISHLRFGPRPIRSTYLVDSASFVACHQWFLLERHNVLEKLRPGGVLLLNSPFSTEDVWDELPAHIQKEILSKKARVFVIDANSVAAATGMGRRINTIMQACFFAISGVLPREEAIAQIKKSIEKTYGRKGPEVVQKNLDAVDSSLSHMHEVDTQGKTVTSRHELVQISDEAPEFVRGVLAEIMAGRGDNLPVSAMPCDGTFPTGTAKWEKRNIAEEIPVWDEDLCIQCGKCAMVCPHAAIRIRTYEPSALENAPPTFKAVDARDKDFAGMKYTIQVAPEDCTGCTICMEVCPVKSKTDPNHKALEMQPQIPLREQEKVNWEFFMNLPRPNRLGLKPGSIRQQQQQEPLFEFSGACLACGETPYLKLITQLFGDRMLIANATGCSSIFGGNLPTTPFTVNDEGRGPAWSNSLFEDNAEFGMGFRVSVNKHYEIARQLLVQLRDQIGHELVDDLLNSHQTDEAEIFEQRKRVEQLKSKLKEIAAPEAIQLSAIADYLTKKSVWIVGGDGWAYDIGYGGLDHVLASGENVNILVLDTEVYSNTGGQMSKATPRGAVARFAAAGKPLAKKDLGLIAMTYGSVYVGSIALGARDEHTLRTLLEAEAYDGPSLVIAYAHCGAHGIDMATGLERQKDAVDSGRWLLYRFNPDLALTGQNPLQLDSRPPKLGVAETMMKEGRFTMLKLSHPHEMERLMEEAQADVDQRWAMYEYLAHRTLKSAVPAE